MNKRLDLARQALRLLPSKTNPRVKRWQAPDEPSQPLPRRPRGKANPQKLEDIRFDVDTLDSINGMQHGLHGDIIVKDVAGNPYSIYLRSVGWTDTPWDDAATQNIFSQAVARALGQPLPVIDLTTKLDPKLILALQRQFEATDPESMDDFLATTVTTAVPIGHPLGLINVGSWIGNLPYRKLFEYDQGKSRNHRPYGIITDPDWDGSDTEKRLAEAALALATWEVNARTHLTVSDIALRPFSEHPLQYSDLATRPEFYTPSFTNAPFYATALGAIAEPTGGRYAVTPNGAAYVPKGTNLYLRKPKDAIKQLRQWWPHNGLSAIDPMDYDDEPGWIDKVFPMVAPRKALAELIVDGDLDEVVDYLIHRPYVEQYEGTGRNKRQGVRYGYWPKEEIEKLQEKYEAMKYEIAESLDWGGDDE